MAIRLLVGQQALGMTNNSGNTTAMTYSNHWNITRSHAVKQCNCGLDWKACSSPVHSPHFPSRLSAGRLPSSVVSPWLVPSPWSVLEHWFPLGDTEHRSVGISLYQYCGQVCSKDQGPKGLWNGCTGDPVGSVSADIPCFTNSKRIWQVITNSFTLTNRISPFPVKSRVHP